MVAFHHLSQWFDNKGNLFANETLIHQLGGYGHLGVYVFFVISGFVIPFSLIKSNYTIHHFFKFIFKRSIRIEIPYIASIALLLCTHFMASHLFSWVEFHLSKKQLLSHFLYLIPFTNYKWYSIIYWTLAVEFQYYLTIALIIPLFTKTKTWLQTLSLLAFSSLPFFRLLHTETAFLYSHGGIFAIGITSCLFYLKRAKLWQYLLILVYGAVITWYFRNTEIAIATVLTSLVICFIKFDWKVGNFMGNISYSLYLVHVPVGQFFIEVMRWYYKSSLNNYLLFLIALSLSIFSAWVFSKIIEEPSKRWASRIKVGK